MSLEVTSKFNIPVITPQPTPTSHPQEVNSLISFYPFTVLWYFLTCGNFLKYQTSFKVVTILVLQFHLKDIFCLQMYTLVTLAHIYASRVFEAIGNITGEDGKFNNLGAWKEFNKIVDVNKVTVPIKFILNNQY